MPDRELIERLEKLKHECEQALEEQPNGHVLKTARTVTDAIMAIEALERKLTEAERSRKSWINEAQYQEEQRERNAADRPPCKSCHSAVDISTCPHPPQTWKERAEENAQAALDRRKEGVDFRDEARRDAAVLEGLSSEDVIQRLHDAIFAAIEHSAEDCQPDETHGEAVKRVLRRELAALQHATERSEDVKHQSSVEGQRFKEGCMVCNDNAAFIDHEGTCQQCGARSVEGGEQ